MTWKRFWCWLMDETGYNNGPQTISSTVLHIGGCSKANRIFVVILGLPDCLFTWMCILHSSGLNSKTVTVQYLYWQNLLQLYSDSIVSSTGTFYNILLISRGKANTRYINRYVLDIECIRPSWVSGNMIWCKKNRIPVTK